MKVPKRVKRLVLLLLFLLVVEYLVLPQIPGIRHSLSLIGSANVWLIGLGVLLELGALTSYAQLTRAVLPVQTRPGLWRVFRIDLSTLAVSHVVPGGSAFGAAVGFRLLTESGQSAPDAGFALGTQGIGSAIVLNVLLWIALVASIPLHGFNAVYTTAAVVGAVLIGGFAALVLLLTRGEARAARILRAIARKVPFLDEDKVHQVVHRLAARLREMTKDRWVLWAAVGWAAANWLLDAASLWAFFAAFGPPPGPVELMVAYGLANVLAAIPVTPADHAGRARRGRGGADRLAGRVRHDAGPGDPRRDLLAPGELLAPDPRRRSGLPVARRRTRPTDPRRGARHGDRPVDGAAHPPGGVGLGTRHRDEERRREAERD